MYVHTFVFSAKSHVQVPAKGHSVNLSGQDEEQQSLGGPAVQDSSTSHNSSRPALTLISSDKERGAHLWCQLMACDGFLENTCCNELLVQ